MIADPGGPAPAFCGGDPQANPKNLDAVGPKVCTKDIFKVPGQCASDTQCSGAGNCRRAAFIDLDSDGIYEPKEGDTPFGWRLTDPTYPQSAERSWQNEEEWLPLEVCLPLDGNECVDAQGNAGCRPCGESPPTSKEVPQGCAEGFACVKVAEYVRVPKTGNPPVPDVTEGSCTLGAAKEYRGVRTVCETNLPYGPVCPGFTIGRDVEGLVSDKNTVFHVESQGDVRNYSWQGLHPHDGNSTVVMVHGSNIVLGNSHCGAWGGRRSRDNVSVAAGEGDDGKVILVARAGSICGGDWPTGGNNEVRAIIPTPDGVYVNATQSVDFSSATGQWHLTATNGASLVMRGCNVGLLETGQPAAHTTCSPENSDPVEGLCVATVAGCTTEDVLAMPNGSVVGNRPVDPGQSIRVCVDDLTNEPAMYWYDWFAGRWWTNFNGREVRCDQRDAGQNTVVCKQRSCDNHDHCPGRFVSCMPAGCSPDDPSDWGSCANQQDGGEGCPAS